MLSLLTPYIDVPIASTTTLAIVVVGFFLLLVAAITVELVRKRVERKRRVAEEWRTVDSILREKAVPEEEQHVVRRIIEQRAPDNPVQAITVRQAFDRCLGEEMQALWKKRASLEEFEGLGEFYRGIREQLGLAFVPVGQRIHSTRELHTGQMLWAAPAVHAQKSQWQRLSVEKVNEAFFYTAPPDADTAAMRVNEEYQCRMWREEDARYVIRTTLARIDKDPPLLVFSHSGQLTRVQTRQHFRVHYEQQTWIGILDPPSRNELDKLAEQTPVTRIRGRITNLSGGGCAIITQLPVPGGAYLRITLELPESRPRPVDARLVTATPLGGNRHLIRCNFVNVGDNLREEVMRFVRKRERAQAHQDNR